MLAMTSDFHGQSRKTETIKDTLTRIARAGFSHVHWCHEWTGSYLYAVSEMLQIKEWCDELGLKVKGIHASMGEKGADLKDYASSNDYNRLAGVELLKNRVDLAHILGTDAIVLHLALSDENVKKCKDDPDTVLRYIYRSFDELEPYCKTRHVKLCVENGGGPAELFYPVYDALCKHYDSNFFGFCIDTGHAYLHCKGDCLGYAKRYNDRIFMIHIHDNHGEKDEHLIPFEGGFDWEGFAPILARSPYSFPVLMEPQTDMEGDDAAWLAKALETGSRFTAMVEKYRNA